MAKTIRDPIHKDIRLGEGALELIDTPKFQRLRRVRQLGTANLVYPGANHTRFEHSLGAYHLAGEAARALALDDGDALDLTAAALLHDVGHGPFSHVTDDVMLEYLGKTHVDVSQDAVRSGKLADVLEHHGADPRRVAELIAGGTHLGGLVAGELDCDRMDYLVRDSHYTGVHTGVDLDRLVAAFRATPDGVLLTEDGVQAAEMLLTTRFMMFTTVYYHHACRVAELMVERAICFALEAGEIKPEQLGAMDDLALVHLLRGSKTPAWRFMLAVDQRKLMKVAYEADLDAVTSAKADAFATDRTARRRLEAEVAAAVGLEAVDVIVDAPRPPAGSAGRVRVLGADGTVRPLTERSHLVASLAAGERDAWRLRVLAPASVRGDVAKAAEHAVQSA